MGEPAYRAVASVLRKEIQQGRWRPKERLPTGRELQERFGVSSTTVKAAIAELTRENLVYTATSRGTIVRNRETLDHVVTRPLRPDRPGSGYDIFVETVSGVGRKPSKEFSFSIEPAPAEIARRLGDGETTLYVRREVMQMVDDEPWSWEVSYYPRDLAEETGIDSPGDILEGTTRRLRDRGYAETAWIDENSTHPAEADEAHALAVPAGTWISDFIRTGATDERVTRVTRTRRIAERNRVVHELGSDQGLDVIRAARAANEAG